MMQTRKSILVVEDESDLAELLRYNLEREGYACKAVTDGGAALVELRKHPPDLIVLDRMLPGTSGDDVITQVRREPSMGSIPVLMLTAKADEPDQLVGFALGADDYVTKPFSMKVLLARVAALFRRREVAQAEPPLLKSGPVQLDVSRHEVRVDDEQVAVTPTEFRILKALMGADGRVLNRARLIETVLGAGVAVTDRTIDVHITALRRKLGEAAAWVQTVRGVGYTYREP